jgi:ferritin-like metal-binding protein YciE
VTVVSQYEDKAPPSISRNKEDPMATQPKKLEDLFYETLKDIYFAEKKILIALPRMAKAAQNEDLAAAFEKHEGETEGQIERLEEVFGLIDKRPQGKNCPAIIGIVEEAQEIIKEYKGSPALDAGLVGAAQAVEHYEISRYGTLRAWAEALGLDEAVELLQATLEEEEATDEALTELAKAVIINQQAEGEEEAAA